jgi:uncharacterized membrane protein HdeD (DUF308 family)
MGIGLGIVLLVAGLILVADVINVGTAFVDEGALGWILIIAGVISLVFALVINTQHRSSSHVVEERHVEP